MGVAEADQRPAVAELCSGKLITGYRGQFNCAEWLGCWQACDGCPDRERCRGVRPDYLDRFGDAEIAEVRGQAATIEPRRGLAVVG